MKRFGILMATAALGAALMASGPAAAFRGGWHGGGWHGGGWHGGGLAWWMGGWHGAVGVARLARRLARRLEPRIWLE